MRSQTRRAIDRSRSSHPQPVQNGPDRKLQPERHLEKIPARHHGNDRRKPCNQERTTRDKNKERCPEQSKRQVGTKRFKQRRHREQSCKYNQHVAMPEFDRSLVPRSQPIFYANHNGKQDHRHGESQRKKAGTRQSKVPEINERGLPRKQQARGSKRARDANPAAAGADRAKQRLPGPSADARRSFEIAAHRNPVEHSQIHRRCSGDGHILPLLHRRRFSTTMRLIGTDRQLTQAHKGCPPAGRWAPFALPTYTRQPVRRRQSARPPRDPIATSFSTRVRPSIARASRRRSQSAVRNPRPEDKRA